MKNWLTIALAGALLTGGLTSCDKDETKVTLTPSSAITATSTVSSVTLLQANASANAIGFNWTPVTFTLNGSSQTTPPEPTYYIQFDEQEDGFGYVSIQLEAGAGPSKFFTVQELNSRLVQAGLTPGVAKQLYARVVAGFGPAATGDQHTFASEPIAVTVTPYLECLSPNTEVWSLVGPAGNGWPGGSGTSPADVGIELKWNCDDKAYEARTALNAGDFKFRLNKSWDINMGGPAGDLTQGVAVANNGPNLNIATAGTYTVKLKFSKTSDAAASTTATTGVVTVTP